MTGIGQEFRDGAGSECIVVTADRPRRSSKTIRVPCTGPPCSVLPLSINDSEIAAERVPVRMQAQLPVTYVARDLRCPGQLLYRQIF
jgi:hypothetical protein